MEGGWPAYGLLPVGHFLQILDAIWVHIRRTALRMMNNVLVLPTSKVPYVYSPIRLSKSRDIELGKLPNNVHHPISHRHQKNSDFVDKANHSFTGESV